VQRKLVSVLLDYEKDLDELKKDIPSDSRVDQEYLGRRREYKNCHVVRINHEFDESNSEIIN